MPRQDAYRYWNDIGHPATPEPTRAFAAGIDDPLATRIVGIAREAAERVGTDVAWALTCLQNSVNVRRRG